MSLQDVNQSVAERVNRSRFLRKLGIASVGVAGSRPSR